MGDLDTGTGNDAKINADTKTESELKTLRTLLLGGDPEEVLKPDVSPEALSKVLPEAITQAHEQGPELILAALPTVESAIHSSVQMDNHILADALFPVIGPATRQSISSAIGNLVQSLNQTLDYSLSPRSIQWRIEALRTGKSFAEVVLIRTLVYQVEQMFLIHKETGLLIRHSVASSAIAKDPDLISAMLTAIQDFIQDSFDVETQDSLNSLKVGDFTLLVEEGPEAIIAGVIRGTPPNDLSELLRSQLEKIHRHFDIALHNFDGDQAAFPAVEEYLEDCFQSKFKGTKELQSGPKKPLLSKAQQRLALALAGLLLLGLGSWAFLTLQMNWQSDRQWQQFIDTLSSQPGIVVIDQQKHKGVYHLQGLRDPLAKNPSQLLSPFALNPQKVQMIWRSYLSLDPAFLADRTTAVFNPPSTVSMQLTPTGVLKVSGSASETWISRAKQLSEQVDGVTAWQDTELVSTERVTLRRLQSRIEHRRFVFQPGEATLRSPYFRTRYQETLDNQVADIAELIETAEAIDRPVTVKVIAYGDQRGQQKAVLQLAQTRANTLKRYLTKELAQQGIIHNQIQAAGTEISSTEISSPALLKGSNLAKGSELELDAYRPVGEGSAACFEVRF